MRTSVSALRRVIHLAAWGLALAAVWWALRGVPLAGIAVTLERLDAGQLAVLALVNLLVVGLFTARWWIILRGQGDRLSFPFLLVCRLAGFGVSYFTPGTQFGGEPLQVAWLHRHQSAPIPDAAASVALDRVIDLLGSATFLIVGIAASLGLAPIPAPAKTGLLILAATMLALPAVFLGAAWRGLRPAASLLRALPKRWTSTPRLARWRAVLEDAERQISAFCRHRPRELTLAIALSVASWVTILGELMLMLHFLDVRLSIREGIAVLTAARLAFLVPVPGALGALEASQVFALTALGHPSTEGLAVGLLIRARDIVFGGVGLLIGWWLARSTSDARREPAVG